MAYRTYAGKLQKSDDAITLVAAGSADSVLFTRTAYYAALGAGSHVLTYKRSIGLGVDGQLISTDGATVMGGTSAGTTEVRIGETGSVASNGGNAFELTAGSLTFANRGEVSGSTALLATANDATLTNSGAITGRTAIDLTAGGATIFNSGEIVGTTLALRIDGGFEDQQVANTGLVSGGRSTAIDVNAGGNVLITNSGTITGRVGINLDAKDGSADSERTVVNTGTITGTYFAVFGSAAADTLRNDGRISGAVNLFAGDDLYDGALGSISGWVLGGAGYDTIVGGAGRDRLDGGSEDDELSGGGGNDVLLGGSGVDLLDGGEGRDIASYGDSSEGLILYLREGPGTGDGTDTFVSIEGIEGGSGSDFIIGSAGSDWLYGRDGDDSLYSQGGRDVMIGGRGNDYYEVGGNGVGAADDQVIEQAGEGIDTVYAYASYALPDNVEYLQLDGSFAGSATGNDLNNGIIGSDGSDILDGLLGNDILNGRGDRTGSASPRHSGRATSI